MTGMLESRTSQPTVVTRGRDTRPMIGVGGEMTHKPPGGTFRVFQEVRSCRDTGAGTIGFWGPQGRASGQAKICCIVFTMSIFEVLAPRPERLFLVYCSSDTLFLILFYNTKLLRQYLRRANPPGFAGVTGSSKPMSRCRGGSS
jgi:hypothetical protein